jgi:ADP-heptose:LPS heptosyltransferase
MRVLVHLASGIGNIVLATPLLLALHRHGCTLDLLVDRDRDLVPRLGRAPRPL